MNFTLKNTNRAAHHDKIKSFNVNIALEYSFADKKYSVKTPYAKGHVTFNNYLNGSSSQFDFRTNINANITNVNLSTKFVIITFTYRTD